jgi:hypothetical protein
LALDVFQGSALMLIRMIFAGYVAMCQFFIWFEVQMLALGNRTLRIISGMIALIFSLLALGM